MYGNRQSRMERFCETALELAQQGSTKITRKVYRSESKRLSKQLGLTVTKQGEEEKRLIPVVISWEETYKRLLRQKNQNGGLQLTAKNFAERLALEVLKSEEK